MKMIGYCIKILYATVEIKGCNVLIDGKNFFDVPIKNKEKACQKVIEMERNNDYMIND